MCNFRQNLDHGYLQLGANTAAVTMQSCRWYGNGFDPTNDTINGASGAGTNVYQAGGDLTLEFFATPGHTPDHCSIRLPEISLLLAGDAAEQPLPFVGDGGLRDLRASLKRLAALEPRAAFYCHAPVDAGPDLIRANLAYFDRLEARCRVALASGAPAQPATDADLEALIDFPFAAAIPPGVQVERGFYRPGHHAAIRAMLARLGGAV